MHLKLLGDSAVLIEVGDDPVKVRTLARALSHKTPGIHDIVPAFTSVAVYYDPLVWMGDTACNPWEAVSRWIKERAACASEPGPETARRHDLPVCYGGEHGPDLEALAKAKKMPAEEIIRLHSGGLYFVRTIGFSPGFPYLDGLPDVLHMPRRATPRVSVPAGSVGIGGSHAGIYTLPTPGGWHLLGRTPTRLFDSDSAEPSLLAVGDSIRFYPIDAIEYERLSR